MFYIIFPISEMVWKIINKGLEFIANIFFNKIRLFNMC
jgi:hypothetical protein